MRKLESVLLEGPAGKLEALLEEPEGPTPREACVVCHPHPLYGGTMHNKVVHRLARGLRRSGTVVLRFNFRGVGRSHGTYDQGVGEIEDARTALRWLRERYPSLPWSLAGFSFGAQVILNLGCPSGDAARLIAAGFPVPAQVPEALERCAAPKIFIQSTRDPYGPKEKLEALFRRLREPKRLVWIDARDHFFTGALDGLEEAVSKLGGNPAEPGHQDG